MRYGIVTVGDVTRGPVTGWEPSEQERVVSP
jgi:hypothetical protein